MTGRQILEGQRDALTRAIATATNRDALPIARRYLARAQWHLTNMTDFALNANVGLFGNNGWQPQVDRVCEDLRASAIQMEKAA